MKAPRQWINTWPKEDLKRPDLVNCFTHVTIVLDKKLKQATYKLKVKYMKTPRQWINTWLKEDPKNIDSVDCFMACYQSPSWTEYIQQNSKTKNKTKDKNAELEKTDVPIRPGSKSKKGQKVTST